MAESEHMTMLREMLILACPNPNGTVDITRDAVLKQLMTNMGFEFLVRTDKEIAELRETEPFNKSELTLEEVAKFLSSFVEECTNDDKLREAFKQFDADSDNKLSLEEFEFFMTSFHKSYNDCSNKKLIEEMLAIIYREGLATKEEPKFDIDQMISKMRTIWT